MNERDLQRALASSSPPDEAGAERRAWSVVRTAFAEHEALPARRRFARPLLAAAAVAALVAAALSPPGRAVLDEVRDALAPTRVEPAAPTLYSVPSPGRLLVESTAGAWVVHADGSNRLLPGYREASWSPHGRFIVGVHDNRLAALEADGAVHWTLARPNVRFARWGGTLTDTRIAYASTPHGRPPALRAVAGDGTGDHWLAKDFVEIAPAWMPGAAHLLAVAHRDGRIRLWDADDRALIATSRRGEAPLEVAWSSDGSRLYALEPHQVRVLSRQLRRVDVLRMPRGWTAGAMAVRPHAYGIAIARSRGAQSEVEIVSHGRPRQAFAGSGTVSGVEWSPDGRWLLIALEDADQWLFVRTSGTGTIKAVSNITGDFASDRYPTLAGWCCPR